MMCSSKLQLVLRGRFNDLWRYNESENQWHLEWQNGNITDDQGEYGELGVPSATNSPPARSEHAMWVDANDNIWIFGGFSIQHVYSDLWVYDRSTSLWVWMSGSSPQNPSNTTGPSNQLTLH
jgi:N-acetylneuraminic acid mutarotase